MMRHAEPLSKASEISLKCVRSTLSPGLSFSYDRLPFERSQLDKLGNL